MKRILVTGVAGFIGSAVARSLRNLGHEVVGVDDISNGYLSNIPDGIQFLEFDLANKENLKKLPTNIDLVLHLAGQSSGEISFENPIVDLEKNTVSTLNLIDFSIINSVEKLIYASSMSVYGEVPDMPISEDLIARPLSCYGVGKLCSENYLKVFQENINSISMRMFNVYGPGQDLTNMKQGMLSIYISQALKNKKIQVKGSIDRFRDFIHIDDMVDAWIKASLNEEVKNGVFNVASGKKTKVSDILGIINKKLINVPVEILEGTPGDQYGIYADISLIKKKLNFLPTKDIEEGIFEFIDWCQVGT